MRVSIQTTMTNHRQEIETSCREETTSKQRRRETEHKKSSKKLKKQKKPYFQKSYRRETPGDALAPRIKFKSVLAQPFSLWNEIEEIVSEFLVDFSTSQRSHIIKNLIRFLELKVMMGEYKPSGLLSPTEAVAHVWHVLILETELYRDVVYAIQDFHARPHRFIHHALFRKYHTNEYYDQLERTQRLFKSYYGTEMPAVLWKEVDSHGNPVDLPTSVIVEDTSVVTGTMAETFPDEKSPKWYAPWLPSCHCFGVFEDALCGRKENRNYEEIYVQGENVSLLSTPRGLAYE
ncbi:unnamed protein product [Pseudo-nitzschia multistriata]|uniref:Uncharacterized protein n=1 Tax=Pseudo-nitzschia multistriata TaxID=183589 RepID=A0A448ZEW6_9STRA|nr:unnamed protein product [Pseudo-nitzschia multistriata]